MFDVSQYAWNKVLLIIGSFIGVNIANTVRPPAYLKGKSAAQIALLSSAIAGGLAVSAGGAVLEYFGVPSDKVDVILFTGLAIGFLSPALLQWWRNFVIKTEDKSIDEVVKDIKDKL